MDFLIFFPNFRKSEFGWFEKQEIKLFWPNLDIGCLQALG